MEIRIREQLSFIWLLLLFAYYADTIFPSTSAKVLESPKTTDLGAWGGWDNCPEGEYVTGMELKMQPDSDVNGMTGVKLFCARSGTPSRTYISSDIGLGGEWMSPSTCPNFGFVVGFQLKSDSIRGRGVQRGANNLRLFCQDPEIQLTYLPNVNGSWGEWTEAQNCPADHAACGIQTQINNGGRMGRFSSGNSAVNIGNVGNATFV
jgi:hypothetical protein